MSEYRYAWAAHAPVLVHGRHGVFRHQPNDVYIGRSLATYGEYSELELRPLLGLIKPGDTVVEVGANIGAHAVPLARKLGPRGRLIAYEPQFQLFETLRLNLALNGLRHAEARRAAAGARAETLSYAPPPQREAANLGGVAMSRDGRGDAVPAVRLDDDLKGVRPALIKIDVEGMEEEVLIGAARTIATCRPAIYLENDRRERSAALIRRLLGMGYCPFWSLPPLFNPANYFGIAQNVFGRIVSVNMLCIPRERLNAEGVAGSVQDPEEPPPLGGPR